jgi:hypothetical protein
MTPLPVTTSAADYLHASLVRKTITIGDPGRTVVEPVRFFQSSERSVSCTGAGLAAGSMLENSGDSAQHEGSPRTILSARRQ